MKRELDISEICDWLRQTQKGKSVIKSDPFSPFYYVAESGYAEFIKLYNEQHVSKLEDKILELKEMLEYLKSELPEHYSKTIDELIKQ